MFKGKFLFIFIFLIYGWVFFFHITCVLAVDVGITNFPSMVSDEPFEISVIVEGAKDGTNYLRVDLYKDGTNNYFGETFNGNVWYGGSDGKSYYPVEIKNSSASAKLSGRLGKPTVGEYPGPGIYKLKIRRYTASGNSASGEQSPIDVEVVYIAPTPTPVSTPTPKSTTYSVAVTPATQPETQTPVPTRVPTPLATKKPVSSPTASPSDSHKPEVLGRTEENSNTSEPAEIKTEDGVNGQPVIAFVFIALGTGFMVLAVFLAYKKYKNDTDKMI